MIKDSGDRTEFETGAKRDLYYFHLKSRAGIDLAIGRALSSKKAFNERKFYGA